MTKHEFEQIAGYEVSDNDYYNIIEPMYLAVPENITKTEFVKMLNKKRFALPKEKCKVVIGVKQMPNGTWMTYEAEMIDIDIKKGKIIVKRLTPNRCWAEIGFDFYYTDVIER